MSDFRLIATDLDDTLIGGQRDIQFIAPLREEINRLRREKNVQWAVCTGRSLHSFRSMFEPFEMMGIMPDFAIFEHKLIYSVRASRYIPHRLWNWQINWQAWLDKFRSQRALLQWLRMVRRFDVGARTLVHERGCLCMRLDSEDKAAAVATLLKEQEGLFKHLRVFRYQSEIDVRTIPFTKGLAVLELARHIGVGSSQTLCVGDGHNDLSMIAAGVARFVGCPANSAAEIIEEIHHRGGHIARAPSLEGVLEIIRAHETGPVFSDLPADWEDPADGENPRPPRHHGSHKKRTSRRRIVLVALGVYVVVTAFASLGLIPFSRFVMWPFVLVEMLLRWVISFLLR